MNKANPKTLRGPGPSDLDGLDVPSPVELEAGGKALHDYADRSDTLRDAVKVLMRTDAGAGARRTQPDVEPSAEPADERGGDADDEAGEAATQEDADDPVEEERRPRVARRAIRREPPEEPPRRTRLWFAIAAMFLFVSLLAFIAWQGAGTTDGTNPTAAPTDAARTVPTTAVAPTPTATSTETQAPPQAESSAPVTTITPTQTAVAPATIATTGAKPTATATVTSSPTAGPKTSSSSFWVMKGTP